MHSIPLCFYSMQKVLLDDDHEFTQSIQLKMQGNDLKSFNSPDEALNYLTTVYKPKLTTNTFITLDNKENAGLKQQTFHIHLEKLEEFLLNQYQDISVILVDHYMPKMCGLNFLKKINHLPMKKILITGDDNQEIAINAFNNGLVDSYIKKTESNFPNRISHEIFNLEWKYFSDLSHSIIDLSFQHLDYLRNKNFVTFFKKIIEKYSINSFYLSNIQGNFIISDKNKTSKILLIRNKKQIQELTIVAREDGGTPSVIKQLEENHVIPFFGEEPLK